MVARLLLLYLGLPVALALLWGAPTSLARFADVWLQNAVVCGCIGGVVHGAHAAIGRSGAWPASARTRAVIHGAIVLLGTLVGGELASRALAAGWGADPASVRWNLWRSGLVISGLVTTGFVAYEHLRARIVAAELGEERAQRAALLAELRATQARTQPHFLFNSLNTVAALIEEDPARAEQVLERLSSLFRYALTAGKRTAVPLREELAAVHDYLVVEGTRFSDRLAWTVDVAADCGDLAVPPFVLQPLVENAVQHGLGSRTGPGRVTVRVSRDDALHLEVEDDGVGFGRSARSGAGTALADLRERLSLLHGARARVVCDEGPAGGARVRVDLPLAPFVAP